MGRDRDSKGAPILLGSEFEEDEATVLDVPAPSLSPEKQGALSDGDVFEDKAEAPPQPRRLPPSVADDDDDLDKTEMMEQPRLDEVDAPLARAVVPLDREEPPRPSRRPLPEEDEDELETLQLSRPLPPSAPVAGPRAEEPRTQPHIRPIDRLRGFDEPSDASDDKTLTRPKLVRMTFRPESPPSPSDEVFADTSRQEAAPPPRPLPAPRPLPPPAGGPAASPPRPKPSTVVEDEPTGSIVMEVPADAVIFVDGVELARGPCTLKDVGRFARVNLRVHRAGCRPWVRTLTLDGEASLTVTPDFERR